MPRPKDDADKLKKDRQERRALLNGLQDSDFEEISEVTNPAIHVHLPPAKSPSPPPAAPPPRSSLASSETVLSALDRLPTHHRVWVVLGIILAVVVLLLAGRLAL